MTTRVIASGTIGDPITGIPSPPVTDFDKVLARVNALGSAATQAASTFDAAGAAAAVQALIPAASSTNPAMNSAAAVGTSTAYARADHVHPSDTSRAAAPAGSTGQLQYNAGGGALAAALVSYNPTYHSIAEGNGTSATGSYSHAEGQSATAAGNTSHAEGNASTSSAATYAHAEGGSTANANYAHAEGYGALASGYAAHAEGSGTASGQYSHAEGYGALASGYAAHAEGYETTAAGNYSHAEGSASTGSAASYAHAEGTGTASASNAHAEGAGTTASNTAAHAEGTTTSATGVYSHAEGSNTTASGSISHAEGQNTTAAGNSSHAEGQNITAAQIAEHAEGVSSTGIAGRSHLTVEGPVAVSSWYELQIGSSQRVSIPPGWTFAIEFCIQSVSPTFHIDRWQGFATVQNTGGVVAGTLDGAALFKAAAPGFAMSAWGTNGSGGAWLSPGGPGAESASPPQIMFDTSSGTNEIMIKIQNAAAGARVYGILTINKVQQSGSAYSGPPRD